ncbi:GNAT family N-acetyltransferase [Priestia megaterium]|nr:GNAT family N-acetyltransferase [Priestia megaterium]
MKIKKADDTYTKEIARIYVDSWRTTYKGLVPDAYLDSLSYEESKLKWTDFLEQQDSIIYVALNSDQQVVGFASAQRATDVNYDGELYSLYLLKEDQGYGIGKQLVSAITTEFLSKGFRSMMVWAMKQNHSATSFYQRLGGRIIAERLSTFGEKIVEDVAYGWDDLTLLETH